MDTLFDMQKQHVHYGIIPARKQNGPLQQRHRPTVLRSVGLTPGPIKRHAIAGWPAAQFRVVGAGPSVQQMHAGSMEPLPPAHTPVYEHKRHRLTQLLDKLAVHITNNNHYPTPAWLVQEERPKEERSKEERPKEERPKEDDLPLDLSVKADRGQPEVFACTACGETFSVHDRLTKHVASRHRNKVDNVRSYECPQCCRKFARSDMLTRHARLHTGVKPYACRACGQVFSRSDHLATHQRTHTGEKPYRCPSCPYAACRRDMITRHMRTHMRRAQPV